jgi:hypothetical protein
MLAPGELGRGRIVCESPASNVQVFALHSKELPDRAYGWLFSTTREAQFSIKGLAAGRYTLTWFDPWTGEPAPDIESTILEIKENRSVSIDALPVLKILRKGLNPFPTATRYSKGHDVAFKIEPVR